MVIENTVEATPIMLPAITVSISAAPFGRAGTIQSTSLRNWAKPARSSHTITVARIAASSEKSAG